VPEETLAAAAEAGAARQLLGVHGFLDEDEDLRQRVHHAVAKIQQMEQELQDLSQMELDYVDVGQRYYRERQYRVNVAAVASRVILRAHPGSHTGSVATCETCAADRAVVGEASGVRAPGN
jgi:hypothetical protein